MPSEKSFEEFEPHYNYEVPLNQLDQHLISLHLFYGIPIFNEEE